MCAWLPQDEKSVRAHEGTRVAGDLVSPGSFQPPDLLALMHWARVGCPVTQGKLLEQETVSLAFHVAQCTLLA